MYQESEVLELKAEIVSDIKKEIIAFANTATENFIREMITETDGYKYEDTRSLNQKLTFVDTEKEFGRKGLKFTDTQKKNLGIMDNEGIYTNLGLLLSDQCEHTIKAAVFKGYEKENFQDRREFEGSVFKQLNDAYAFIELNNQTNSTFEGLYRVDSRDYSVEAIREALLNAILHREYSFSGSVLISVFSDRLEIASLGGLVEGLEPEDIFEGASQTRNEKLANIFYRLEYVESYGTGIRKIKMACEEKGVEAKFVVTNALFKVILPNANYSEFKKRQNSRVRENRQTPQLGDRTLYDTEMLVYKYMEGKDKVSRRMVQEALGLKQTKCGLVLKSLEEKGKIIRRGQSRSTTFKINN